MLFSALISLFALLSSFLSLPLPEGSRAVEHYRLQQRPVSLDQEQLLLETAKHETRVEILQYVLPELTLMREREYNFRYFYFTKGLQPTSLEQFTGGPVALVCAVLFFPHFGPQSLFLLFALFGNNRAACSSAQAVRQRQAHSLA